MTEETVVYVGKKPDVIWNYYALEVLEQRNFVRQDSRRWVEIANDWTSSWLSCRAEELAAEGLDTRVVYKGKYNVTQDRFQEEGETE